MILIEFILNIMAYKSDIAIIFYNSSHDDDDNPS